MGYLPSHKRPGLLRPPDPLEGTMLEQLESDLTRLHDVIEQILALADEFKGKTIEQMLAKSDLEVGMEFFGL
ncbi:hypothetical protein WDW86_14270 [Bdellovibrionota bacterium FG-2]